MQWPDCIKNNQLILLKKKKNFNLFANILLSQNKKTFNYQGSNTMKKSTMAVAALLTALSAGTVMSVAYADDTSAPVVSGCKGCKGCKGSAGCKDHPEVQPHQATLQTQSI